MQDTFTVMLSESAANVKRRKQLLHRGVPLRDVLQFTRTRTPGTITDKQFMSHKGTLDRQIKDKKSLAAMVAEYERCTGRKPNRNMIYVPALVPSGCRVGHPDAWVESGNARSQILKTAERQNVPLRGPLERDAKETLPVQQPKLARTIVNRRVRELKRTEPELATGKKDAELREIVVDRHSLKR